MTTHICEFTPSDGEPESARALLWRHGLPEDIVDGALALFARELVGKIRAHRDHTRGAVQATKVMDFAADLISPENWARTEPVPAGRDALRDLIAEVDPELLHVVDAYLTATHTARHDVIGEGGTCAGCDLRDRVRRAAGELRRMADEAQQQTETHQPARGDQFEAWLKAQRDEYEVESSPQWAALDEVLDTYRLHADTGALLSEHVCEGKVAGDCECLEQPAVVAAVADEEPDTETEARPPTHTWNIESPRREEWASWGANYDEREWAQERYESAIEHSAPRPFRLVRATTTYTVEAEHTPAASQPDEPKVAAPAVPQCDGCGHLVHRARKCPAARYGERCECDEPVTAPGKEA